MLKPKEPPGRRSRKARAYTGEIAHLHDRGYSCEAIRQALADSGVVVSRSTVTREVTRHAKCAAHSASSYDSDNVAIERIESPTSIPINAFASDPRSNREIAESFVPRIRVPRGPARGRRDTRLRPRRGLQRISQANRRPARPRESRRSACACACAIPSSAAAARPSGVAP